ncbi:MAG TPA: sigma-70 family RNA polymerase sigma factor, partial [Pirellulales bacterium]|nr:sigma-70 family RNA polymerase sigma factor [Pirellulales bacterium]
LEDLVGYGQIGLAEAARDFDPGRGGQFTTYAYYRVRGAIFDGLGKMSWFDRADYARGRYAAMADEVLALEGTEGPPASLDGEVRWLQEVSGTLSMVYLCSQASEEQGEGAGAGSVVDRSTPSPPAMAIAKETAHKLRELIDALPADAATLIKAAYFEGLSLKAAGERLGISKAWASRLHAKALGQLARALTRLEAGHGSTEFIP